jgi:hypothetical protein
LSSRAVKQRFYKDEVFRVDGWVGLCAQSKAPLHALVVLEIMATPVVTAALSVHLVHCFSFE